MDNRFPAKTPVKSKSHYDVIIDINSIRFLNDPGWKIEYSDNKSEKNKVIESSKKIIVSVLGNSNRGKTHILQRLSGVNLKPGYQNQTRGLSIKFYNEEIILLDTAGTNAPLLVDNEKAEIRTNQKEIDHIHLCQIITNYILQSFVINQAHILICVVGMLTASEQQFLNKIKKFSKNKKKLIIIHNLIKCTTNEDIIKYKDNVLLKMISNNFEERKIPIFDKEHKNLFNKYFIENDNQDIRHFIYCNDDTEELDYYNKATISFIQKCIKVELKKQINIIQNLVNHIKEISSVVLKNEIKTIQVNNDLIKCEEKIDPKEILYDGYDDIIFIGKEMEPLYRYYKEGNLFIIEIDLCSDIKDFEVKQTFDKITKETIFKITGERMIEDIKDEEETKYGQEFYTFVNTRETYTKFKLEIRIKLAELGIRRIKKDFKYEMKFGILFFKFEINYQ